MSDNPKSRGEEATVSNEESSVDIKRMLNVGQEVTLSFGKFIVKELSVFDLISTMSEGLDIFVGIADTDTSSEMDLIKLIVSDPQLQEQFCKIVALCCQSREFELFKEMTTSDLFKVVKVIKDIIDFEEIKETFFELGLQKYLNKETPISTEM
jgi:hypothetical protein